MTSQSLIHRWAAVYIFCNVCSSGDVMPATPFTHFHFNTWKRRDSVSEHLLAKSRAEVWNLVQIIFVAVNLVWSISHFDWKTAFVTFSQSKKKNFGPIVVSPCSKWITEIVSCSGGEHHTQLAAHKQQFVVYRMFHFTRNTALAPFPTI